MRRAWSLAASASGPCATHQRVAPALNLGDVAEEVVGGDDLRALVRPGDVLCAVSPAHDGTVLAAFRQASTWGAMTIWVGAGPRPEPGSADHVLWSGGGADPALAPYDGSLSLRYPSGSVPTAEGAIVARAASHVLRHATALARDMRELRVLRGGVLRVAASLTIAEHLLPGWLATDQLLVVCAPSHPWRSTGCSDELTIRPSGGRSGRGPARGRRSRRSPR